MKISRKLLTFTLLLSFTTTSLRGQEFNDYLYQSSDNQQYIEGDAYAESTYAAHWSAYIPITVMVAAAILFGIADQTHVKPCYRSSSYSRSSSSSSHTSSGHY